MGTSGSNHIKLCQSQKENDLMFFSVVGPRIYSFLSPYVCYSVKGEVKQVVVGRNRKGAGDGGMHLDIKLIISMHKNGFVDFYIIRQ